VGYCISGFFITVLYYPFFWITLSMSGALRKIVANKEKHAIEHSV
jgi:putative inorganic carbon (hco3(-)) transporter